MERPGKSQQGIYGTIGSVEQCLSDIELQFFGLAFYQRIAE